MMACYFNHSGQIFPMVKKMGVFEAKTHFSSLLAEVAQGNTFVITKHGKRVAELRPVQPTRKKAKFGCAKGPGFYMAPDFDAPLECFKEYQP
jgi:prevent-host-death family protein